MTTKTRLGAPRHGKEVRERYSVRLEPARYRAAIKKFGSFTAAVEAGLDAVGLVRISQRVDSEIKP